MRTINLAKKRSPKVRRKLRGWISQFDMMRIIFEESGSRDWAQTLQQMQRATGIMFKGYDVMLRGLQKRELVIVGVGVDFMLVDATLELLAEFPACGLIVDPVDSEDLDDSEDDGWTARAQAEMAQLRATEAIEALETPPLAEDSDEPVSNVVQLFGPRS